MLAYQTRERVRALVHRTRGHSRGPITRLMSPSDLGELVKPFVFLDLAVFEGEERMAMDRFWHPHSGIATVTVMLDGAVRAVDTMGRDRVLPEGRREWSTAGHGGR